MRSGTCLPGTCPGTETSNYAVCPTQPNPAPEGRTETLQLTFFPQVLAWYIQYQNIYSKMYIPQPCARRAHRNPTTHIDPPSVGMIYSIPTYIFKNVHSPTLRPKGAQKLSKLHSAPKCWHNISNTNLYFQLTYIPQPCARRAHWNTPTHIHPPSFGMIYSIPTYNFITSTLGGWM